MSKIGNFLKVAQKGLSSFATTQLKVGANVLGNMVGMPGAGNSLVNAVSTFLPGATNSQQAGLTSALSSVLTAPAVGAAGQQEAGSLIKNFATDLGLGANASSIAGALGHALAGLKPEQASTALDNATSQLTWIKEAPQVDPATGINMAEASNSFLGGVISKQEAKDVLNSAVAGVKSGITTGLMNTETGKQMVRDGTNAKLTEIMPLLLGLTVVALLGSVTGFWSRLFK